MHQQNDNATDESQSQIWNALKKLKPIVYNRLQIHNSPAKNADRKLHIWIYEIGCIISSKSSHITSYKSMFFLYHDHTSNVDHINWTKKQCINQMEKHHMHREGFKPYISLVALTRIFRGSASVYLPYHHWRAPRPASRLVRCGLTSPSGSIK